MKKLIVLFIVLALLVTSIGTALAAPWNNPNGYWIEDVVCENGTFDVFVPNGNTQASFNNLGGVGVMKALYIDFGNGYEMVWSVRGEWSIQEYHLVRVGDGVSRRTPAVHGRGCAGPITIPIIASPGAIKSTKI